MCERRFVAAVLVAVGGIVVRQVAAAVFGMRQVAPLVPVGVVAGVVVMAGGPPLQAGVSEVGEGMAGCGN